MIVVCCIFKFEVKWFLQPLVKFFMFQKWKKNPISVNKLILKVLKVEFDKDL
jgi:hypothetical protein